MKVAFWSNYQESGTTVDMIAVAATMALMFRARITLVSNHYEEQSLGYGVLGRNYDLSVREERKYYVCRDRSFHIRKLLSPVCSQPLNGGIGDGFEPGLYYLLQEKLYSNPLQELNYDGCFENLIEEAEASSDYVFMDLQSQGSLNSLEMLENADLVVVCLRQSEIAAHNFFKRYGSLTSKCIFLISSYHDDDTLTKKDFANEFQVHPGRVAAVPYIQELDTGFSDGRLVSYVISNFYCEKSDPQYKNIRYLRLAAKKLLNALVAGNRACNRLNYVAG